MAGVDGTYDCTVKSPLGDQKLTLTVTQSGDAFTGQASGAMGSSDVTGTVSGNTLAWKQQMTVPMPMTLDITAAVDGDTITGSVGAGAFGSFPLTGTRTACSVVGDDDRTARREAVPARRSRICRW